MRLCSDIELSIVKHNGINSTKNNALGKMCVVFVFSIPECSKILMLFL
jgi:hypothetical protein